MGTVGSEPGVSLRNDIARWEDGEEVTSRCCTLSIRRVTEKGDRSHAYHIVECKLEGTSVALQQRFRSLDPEDPEGRKAAFCFALSTGSLPAFKAFLFEHPHFLSSKSADALHLTGANIQSCFTVFVNPRKNSFLGLCFTAALCRFPNVSMRSISFRSNNEKVGIERVTLFLHSTKFRSWVQRVYASKAEICRPDGTSPSKCARCGELEHPAFYDQNSQQENYCHLGVTRWTFCKDLGLFCPDKFGSTGQASEDYLCPTCLMMDGEVIFGIRLEEQSEDAENFWNAANSVYMEDNGDTCCICGCEDNEDLDDLVPCVCESDQAVVHTSCAAACTTFSSRKVSFSGSIPLCFICGRGQGIMQNGRLVKCKDNGMGARGSKRSMNPIQVADVEVKRPRTSSPQTSSPDGMMRAENMPDSNTSPKLVEIENISQVDSEHTVRTKTGAPRHGWRSVDSPVVVPFKKRRLQIAEVPRSPSPPPKQIPPNVVPVSPPRPVSSLLESNTSKPVSLLPKSPSPKLDFLPPDSPSSNATSLLPELSSPTSVPSSKPITPVLNVGSSLPKMTLTKHVSQSPRSFFPRDACPQPRSFSLKQTCALPRNLSPKPPSPLRKLLSRSSDLVPLQLPRLRSVGTSIQTPGSPLNSSEQGWRSQHPVFHREGLYFVDATEGSDVLQTRPSFSPNQKQPSSSQEVEDGELVISTEKNPDDFEVAGELPEVSSQEARGNYSKVVRPIVGGFYDDRSGWDLNTDMETWDKLSGKVTYTSKKMGKGLRTACVSTKQSFDSSMRIVKAMQWVDSSSKLVVEDTEIGKCDECGECREVDATNEILVVSTSLKVVEEACEKLGPERYRSAGTLDNQASLLGTKRKEWNELGEEPDVEEHVDYGDFDCRDGDDAGLKMDEGASMLQGEAYWKVEDTMSNSVLWESTTMSDGGETERKQEDRMESCAEKCSTTGRVKSSGWDQLPEGFDSAEEALKAAHEMFSRRGRGSWINFGGRGSMLNSQGSLSAHRFNSTQDEFRDRSSECGERHDDQSSYGRESSNHTRRLGSSADDYNALWGRVSGRGAAGVHGRGRFDGWTDNQQSGSMGQWGPGRQRSSSGFNSQGARNAAAAATARVESSGFVVAPDGTISRGGRSSRGLWPTFANSRGARGPHITGDLESGPNFHNRMSVGINRSVGRSANIVINRGGRCVRQGARPGGGLAGRGIVDRHGGSFYSGRSVDLRRSESPRRMHSSDHPSLSSRTPGLRPESRITRSRLSPPSPEPFGRAKLFPPSARSQGSPPFSKWSHDRREGESFRDRDFKRPIPPRSFGSSGRTSPHVVHGSSLTDERDWQVLAGTRSSPGARGGLTFSVYSGKTRDGRSPELRRSRRAEDEGYTGSISKDRDHGRNSPREVRDMRVTAAKRDRSRDDEKERGSYRLSSRSTGGYKGASSRDESDDVEPRRHHRSC